VEHGGGGRGGSAVVNYLRNHSGVNQGMIQIVRQLEPTPEGLPLEIYVFTSDINWVPYEGIQADIFDHILSIAPEFGLRVYQRPSGYGLREAVAEAVA
jgi:miniconductance mechanosensitive channel